MAGKVGRRVFGAVRMMPSKRWQARYVGPDGQRYGAPTTFETEAEADEFLANVKADIDRWRWRPPAAKPRPEPMERVVIEALASPGADFVYVMGTASMPDLVKIGRSTDPERRRKQMVTGCPGLTILAVWMCADAARVEAKLHKVFADRREPASEWFRVRPLDVLEALCTIAGRRKAA